MIKGTFIRPLNKGPIKDPKGIRVYIRCAVDDLVRKTNQVDSIIVYDVFYK